MPALGRRKASPSRVRGRRLFDELPEDILILIFCQCHIDELLNLRLTNRTTRDIISEYIATIAPSVARATFPRSGLLLAPLDDPSLYTITWLKGLIPRHLACILVDRHRFIHGMTEQRYGIAAENAEGDGLRARVANGWRILKRLAKISQEVYHLDTKAIFKSAPDSAWKDPLKLVLRSRFDFEVFRRREELVLKRRVEYIQSLPYWLAMDYKLMFILLSSAFRTSISNLGDEYKPWIFDWGCGIDGQRLLRRGNSWLTWFVLHEGPDLFWHQWWTLSPDLSQTKNHIRDRSINAWFSETNVDPDDFLRQFVPKDWKDVNEKCHKLQSGNAREVQKAMEDKIKSGPPPPHFHSINPIAYFTQYAEQRHIREVLGVPTAPVPETLSHVPFHIEFRCPEELFEKHCSAVRERSLGVAPRPRNG